MSWRVLAPALVLLVLPGFGWAQSLPWSPYAASCLPGLAVGVLSGARETTVNAATGRVVALADLRSTSLSVATCGPRGGVQLVTDRIDAGAGAVTASQVEGAWRAAPGLVVEGWSAYARLTAPPSQWRRWAGGARVLFAAPSGPAGAWCGFRTRDRAGLFGDAGGVAAGLWWGSSALPRGACECIVSPDTRSLTGRLAAQCPLGAGLQARVAASTSPSALSLGLRAERGVVRLELERTLNAVLGDGVRLSCARVWR